MLPPPRMPTCVTAARLLPFVPPRSLSNACGRHSPQINFFTVRGTVVECAPIKWREATDASPGHPPPAPLRPCPSRDAAARAASQLKDALCPKDKYEEGNLRPRYLNPC